MLRIYIMLDIKRHVFQKRYQNDKCQNNLKFTDLYYFYKIKRAAHYLRTIEVTRTCISASANKTIILCMLKAGVWYKTNS